MPGFRIHQAVAPEFSEAHRWYSQYGINVAARFTASFELALRGVKLRPTAHAPWRSPFRRARLVRFPYLILFHSDLRQTSILALVHQRREPARIAVALKGRLDSLR